MKKRRIISIATVFIVIFLVVTFTACSLQDGADSSDNSSETINQDSDTSQDGSEAGGDSAGAVSGVSDTRNSASLESWAGDYTFSEYAPPDQNMFYSITIFNENAACYADIYIDGFQTMKRLRAKVIENGNSIDLLFDSYLPENIMDIYKKGDHLLSLENDGTKLFTKWSKIEPMLSENNVQIGEFFEKAE